WRHRSVAPGGGTRSQQASVGLLRWAGQPVVGFPDAPADELWRRCQGHGGSVRPLLQNRNQFNSLYQQRRPHYAAADFTVQVAGKSTAIVVAEIETLLLQNSYVS